MQAAQYIESDRDFIAETSSATFIRERVMAGDCRMLEPIAQAGLKEEIAKFFSVHANCIVIVGSSKLGYSLNPSKCFKPFDDDSDIDVAVVNPRLFEQYWLQMYKAKQELVDWPDVADSRKYLFRGWIRPDKLPLLSIRNQWFDFFNDLQARNIGGPYAVRGGLYFSHEFLEAYQLNGARKAFPEI